MRTVIVKGLCCAALALTLAGCGSARQALPPTGPLSVAEWQSLPVEQKYAADTFERLKLGDPRLEDPQEWEKFVVTVIAVHRKEDLPFDPKAKR